MCNRRFNGRGKEKSVIIYINGKIKVSKSLEEYKNVVNDIKNIDYQSNLNVKFEQFQIALYNYSRAITDQKKYFELSGKIEKIFNKIIIPNSDEYSSRKYTFLIYIELLEIETNIMIKLIVRQNILYLKLVF